MTKHLVAALLITAAACGPSAETQRKLAELETAAAAKDSLLQEVAVSSRLLSDISAQLAKVQVRGRPLRVSSETPLLAQRDTMMQKLHYVIARVDETERRLNESQRRIRGLTQMSDSLKATLDSTVTTLQSVLDNQRANIASLTEQVTALQTENNALRDTVANVTERENSGYYVIGTKEELKQKGIVVEEGGSRVLFVLWRAGRTLAPARDLDPNQFHRINIRNVTSVPLPDPAGEYRIASRQDLEFLATPPADGGKITGVRSIDIAEPAQFWRSSKFLIIVQERGQTGTSGNVSLQ
jgi:regulator of replication initiation timing